MRIHHLLTGLLKRTWIPLLTLTLLRVGPADARLPGIRTIADLDRQAVLHFSIMSDHKGDSPLSSVEFARMEAWVAEGKSAFVVGLGDHLKFRWENSFIPWIKSNTWWREHTYLNVADGENEYYSPTHLQSDYGEGAPILDLVDLEAHAEVVYLNPSEYYARIPAGEYTVHLIQMHYSDNPLEPWVAFPEASRAWMMKTLESIDKGDRDLIIVAAHSRRGSWDLVLRRNRRKALLDKADLVLSATTHNFKAWVSEGYESGSAVCVNTGAVNFAGYMTPNGYVEIHVLKSGAIVGQYVDLTRTQRMLQRGRFAWVKPRDGAMQHIDLRSGEVLAVLEDSVAVVELQSELRGLLKEMTGADLAHLWVANGLPAGPVTLDEVWRVFDKNRNVRVVRVPAAHVDSVVSRFGLEAVQISGDYARVAASHPAIATIIGFTGIAYEAIEPQAIDEAGLREVDIVRAYLTNRLNP